VSVAGGGKKKKNSKRKGSKLEEGIKEELRLFPWGKEGGGVWGGGGKGGAGVEDCCGRW